jgi:hypothetical protein
MKSSPEKKGVMTKIPKKTLIFPPQQRLLVPKSMSWASQTILKVAIPKSWSDLINMDS